MGRFAGRLARCVRITRTQTERYKLRPGNFELPAEQNLAMAHQVAVAAQNGKFLTFVESLRILKVPINQFFDSVMVMDEDPKIRESRLALLQNIAALTNNLADLSHLEGF